MPDQAVVLTILLQEQAQIHFGHLAALPTGPAGQRPMLDHAPNGGCPFRPDLWLVSVSSVESHVNR